VPQFLTASIARLGAALLRQRWVVRSPVLLYQARLGAVFGDRLLMIEHTGRATGQPRRVVLEVIERPSPRQWVVVSGFGEHAQWLRNVDAHPEVRLFLGSQRPRRATAQRLQPEAASACLARYCNAHPHAWARLRPILERTLGHRMDPDGPAPPMVILTTSPEPQAITSPAHHRAGSHAARTDL
jgi:deazaflavin-dependent oxidoreductase (nitroreductase family)